MEDAVEIVDFVGPFSAAGGIASWKHERVSEKDQIWGGRV